MPNSLHYSIRYLHSMRYVTARLSAPCLSLSPTNTFLVAMLVRRYILPLPLLPLLSLLIPLSRSLTMSVTPPTNVPWLAPLTQTVNSARALPGSNFVTLATISQPIPPSTLPTPATRTVVYRGISPLSHPNRPKLTLTTDIRTSKVTDILSNPAGEIVWWFPSTQEQYRFAGPLSIIDKTATTTEHAQEREDMWEKTRENAKITFNRGVPGALYVSEDCKECEGISDNFAVLHLEARSVDYVDLKDGARRKKFEYDESSQTWSEKRVNP